MGELVFTTRGTAQVLADQEKLAAGQSKQRLLAKELSKEYAANEAELKKLGRTAQQIYRDNETATERYNRKIAETKAALQGNVNEAELLKRSTTSLTIEYLKQLDGAKRLTAAEREQLEAKRRHKEQAEAMIRLMPKLTSETHRLMGEYTQTGVALNSVVKKTDSLFSQESVDRFAGIAGKISAVLAPLAAFGNAIESGNQLLRQYGGQAISSAKATGGLAQLAGGDTAKLKALAESAQLSFSEGGFESLADANRLTFELESGGIMGDREFLSRLQAASVDDAAQVAKSTSLVAAAFGRKEAGDTPQLVSKGLAAAGPATGANLGDILQGVAASAQSAKQLGLKDEEVFALVSRIAETTGSGVAAGTRSDALFRAMIRRGFADKLQGKGLGDFLKAIGGMGLANSGLQEFLGRQEAAEAFSIASDVPAFQQRLSEITAAQQGGLSQTVVDSAFSLPDVATRQQVLSDKAQSQLMLQEKALRRERIDSAWERARAQMHSRMGKIPSYPIEKLMQGGNLGPLPIPGLMSFVPDSMEDPGMRAQYTGQSMDDLVKQMESQNAAAAKQLEEQKETNRLLRTRQSSSTLIGVDQ